MRPGTSGGGSEGAAILPGGGAGTKVTDAMRERALLEKKKEDLDRSIQSDPKLSGLKGNVEITIAEGGLRIELVEGKGSVFFESAKSDPKPETVRLLHVIAKGLQGLHNNISIEGHTDSHPVRASAGFTNWELSAERALAARRALRDGGLSEKNIVAVQGYADRNLRYPTEPFNPGNRRVSILVHFMSNPDVPTQTDDIRGRLKRSNEKFGIDTGLPKGK